MPILTKRTYLDPSLLRRATYDRLVPGGSDSGFLHWVAIKKREFERTHPEYKKRGEEGRLAFDAWLERLT